MWTPVGVGEAGELEGCDGEVDVGGKSGVTVGGKGDSEIEGAFEVAEDVFAVV